MIGCKVMRTLASVEIEIMFILGLPCCLSSSSVRCLESDVYPQCLLTWRLPPRLTELRAPECPYHFLRIPLRPLAPPTSLPESTPPTMVHILRRTARMVMRISPAMSSGISASMAEVAAMFESAFRKRFRSSYESSPSLSLPYLPSRKRYRGTSKLVDDSGEDEDEEIEESLDSDSMSEDIEDEDPIAEDEDPAAGDEGLATGVEGPGMDDVSYGLDDEGRGLDDEGHSVESGGLSLKEEEEAVPGALEGDHVYNTFEVGHGSRSSPDSERPKRVSASRQPTLTTWTDPEDGMVYIDVPAYPPPAPPVQTSPFVVPLPISSPVIPLTVPSPVATPATAETEGFLTELRAQVEMQGGLILRDEIFSQRYRFRSLEYELERVAVTFRAIWRPVLALESWAGQTDAQRAALWHAISDMQGENQDLRLQLAEERCARLELAEVVDSMRRGQEPRGGS
ncbi:hypothetical protein Tco_0916461 [Tanacetum coccineum]